MSALSGGTPIAEDLVATIGGERYHVADSSQASKAGGRSWSVERVPAQDGDPHAEFRIDLGDFSQGAGFTFEGIAGTYDYADGWDLSAPGKPSLWPARATGASFVTEDYRGWQFTLGGYLYLARGRYVQKYAINDAPGASWSIIETHDLGANIVCAGRPDVFAGKGYVPRRTNGGGSLGVFHQLTTVATTTAETQTITITGTPTSGTYTLTFDGKTTAALAFNADGPTVQAALRLIAGLEQVTVSSTGSTPNFVHTVVMTGAPGANGTSSPPQMTNTDGTSGGTHNIAHATTVAGVADTWTAFSDGSARNARCFTTWKNKLVLATSNYVRTVSGDPMVAANWFPNTTIGYEVGNSGAEITDLAEYPNPAELMVGKTDGPWKFNDSLEAIHVLPGIRSVVDAQNCVGMAYDNGYMLIPHKLGLLRWAAAVYSADYTFAGADQDQALEAALSEGAGRVSSVAAYGKSVYYTLNDARDGTSALMSLQQPIGGKQRGPLVPHMHQIESGGQEHALVIQSTQQPVAALYPSTWSDDSAVGTITWSNPGNAAAEDGVFATAAAGTSHYIKGLNVAPAIPAGGTVVGIQVDIKRKVSATVTPSFRAVATSETVSPANNLAIGKPTGTTNGDLLVAVVSIAISALAGASYAVTPPSGWSLLGSGIINDRLHSVYYKLAASEGVSWTWTVSGVLPNWAGTVLAYQNVDNANPFAAGFEAATGFISGDGSLHYDTPSQTTIEDHVRLVAIAAPVDTDVALASYPGGTTGRVTESNTSSHPYLNMRVADYDAATAGAIGALEWSGAAGAGGTQIFYLNLGLRGQSTVADNVVKMVKSGSVVGTNKATATAWPSAAAWASYGGSNDLWGTTWTAAEANAATSGIVLSALVTSGVAYVDAIRVTVFYTVSGIGDAPSYLSVLFVAADRVTVHPIIYQLPRANLPVANDPSLDTSSSGATLYTSRYYRPGREVQKTYRTVELWLDANPQVNTPGLQVWASLDNGSAVQLNDTDGAAKTALTTGFHQFFFPATSGGVGHWCQLRPTVPALSGVQVPVALSMRDMKLRGSYRPLTVDAIQAVFVLTQGQFEDLTSMRRTVPGGQVPDLTGLAGPNSAPIPYKDPWGGTGFLVVAGLQIREVAFKEKEESVKVAVVTLRATPYDA